MNTASRPTRLAGAARRHTRTLTVAAVSPLLMIGLGACGSTPQAGGSQSATTLNVGQLGTSEVTKALLEAAGENQTPYTLKYSLYAAGPGLMEAIPSGAVDFGFMADTPPIFAQVAKISVKIVAVQHQLKDGESQVEVVVPQDSPIRSVADLAGKRVSLTEATIMQYTLARVLEKSGAKYGDITPVNLPPSDVPAAFQGGQIDAAAILDPQRAQLKAQGYRTVATGVGLTSGN